MKIPTLAPFVIPTHRAGQFLLGALSCLCFTLASQNASGQSAYTWNGGSGTTGNWTDAANWGGSGLANPQAFLNFNGAARTSNTNDFGAGSPGYQIYFKSGANAFNLYGNAIYFYDFGGADPNIQNEGAVTNQTINFPVANGNNNGTFHVLNINLNTGTSQGPLTFNGSLSSADAGQPLRVINLYGPSAISFNGIISDFDGTHQLALSQLGSGTTTLRASNTFTGDMTVNAGTLVLATNSALASGANFIRLGDTAGSAGANLNLNGGNNLSTSINVRSGSSGGKIIANTSSTIGNATFAGNLYLDADVTLFANAGGSNTLSGAALDLKNQTLTVDGAGSNIISGTLQNSARFGKLVKNNTGTLFLSFTASYTGGTTINQGIVQANASNPFGTGTVTLNNGGGVNARILLNSVTVTNALTMSVVNAGTGLGAVQGIDTTTATWSGPVTINSNAASGGHFVGPLTSGLLTISGPVTLGGSATTMAVRDGIVRFSGGGIYTNMTINAGTTSLGANNGLATTAIVDVGPTARTTLDLNGFNQTLAGVRNTSAGAQVDWVTNSAIATQSTLTLAVSNLTVFNGSIVGNLAVNVVGGTQVYSNSAVSGNGVFGYTGDTTISGGTLKLGGANLLPNGSSKGNMIVTNTGILDLNGVSQTVNGLFGNGTIDTVAGGTPTLTVGSANVNSTFSGLIKNTAGTLALAVTNSAATLTLSGANNTFGGTVNIGTGSVNFRSGVIRAAATQALGTGTVNVGNGGNESTGRLELSNNITLNNFMSLPQRGNPSVSIENLSGNNTLSGTIGIFSGGANAIVQSDAGFLTLGTASSTAISNQVAASTRLITLSGAGNGAVVGNIVDLGTAVVTLTKDGAGTWALSGTDTYSGDTRIVNGLLVISNALALQNSSVDMNAADAGTLNLNNLSATLGGLKGSRSLALGTGTISVGNNNVATVYSGALSGNAFTKVGTGALTLSGSNTHNGATTVSGGELVGSTAGSCASSAVSVSAGATNGVLLATANGQWTCAGLTYSAGTTYADFNFNGIAPSTTTAPLQVNGSLAFNVTPNVIVRSANATIAPGQYPLIKYTGTLSGTPPTTPFAMPVGMTATISNNVANNSIDLVVAVGNAVTWAVGNGAWDINTTANWKNTSSSAVNYLDGEPVVLDDTASGASPISLTLGASVTPLSITANLTNKNYTIVSNGFAILGSGAWTKNGSGTLTIASTNLGYTGAIALNGGTLSIGNAGSIGTGAITMANGTSWLLGSGGVTFVANNLNVASGASVSLSAQGGLGSAFQGIISGDSASIINIIDTTSFDRTFNQFSNFVGTVTVNAAKTMRFSNTSGSNGGSNTTFNVMGTLQPRNANLTVILGAVTGSGTLGGNQTANTGTTVTYSIGAKNVDSTFSGKIVDFVTNSGTNTAVTKVGTGTLTLSGNNTHSAGTTINAGSLIGVTGGSCSNSAVTVNTGATNGVSVTSPGSRWICTNLTYSAGTASALFSFGANTPSTTVAPLFVRNNLTISGTLNIIISGGSTTIPVGVYPLIKYANALSGTVPAAPLSLPIGVFGIITNDTANQQISLMVTNVVTPTLVWTAGTGNWDASSINWTNALGGTLTNWLDNYLAQFDDTASGTGPFTVTLTTNVTPLGVLFTNNASDYTLAGGTITGNGTLTKAGTGKLTLLTTNAATGGIVVSGGTLQGNAATLSGSINNSAALVFDQAVSGSNSATISGPGSLTKTNSGTLALGGNNTFTGNASINQGTLSISSGSNLGGPRSSATTNAVTIDGGTLLATNGPAAITLPVNAGLTVGANGATIDVASGITLDYPAQAISGTGTLTKNGAGTFQIDEGTAGSTYTSLILNAGTIAFNKSSGGLGAGSLVINGGAIRTTGASARTPNNPTILANGDFTLGSATTAAITFANGGAWTLANGTRTVNVDTIVATITGVVDDGGNNYGLSKAGSGTLVLNNADTFGGGILMTAGALNLGNNGAAGTGSTIAYSGGSVQVGSGVAITNRFDNASSSTTDLMMDCPTGSGVWAGPVTSSGSGGFRPGSSGGTLIFTGAGSLGNRNLIVPRGSVIFATNANFSSAGGTIAFGRSTSGSGTSVTVQNNAVLSLTGANGVQLGGAQASPGPIVLTIQDSASVSSGTQLFDLHNSTSASATTVVALNGGALTVGGLAKSQTGGGQTSTISFNGGTLAAGQSTAGFLPALSGLIALVSTNGGTLNDNGFNIAIAQALSHDSALGAAADGGLVKSGAGVTTLGGAKTYAGPTTVNAGTLLISGSTGTNTLTVNSNATLSGTGTVNGAVTVQPGGTVQAGLGGSDTSVLVISNSLALAGNARFNLNRTNAQTVNEITGLTGVAYGGTLIVINVGDGLLSGDSFVLFAAGSYAGGFANIVLPALTGVLVWNTNNLAVDGSISVVPGISPTTLALSSSENPSGYLDPLTFTANVLPTNAAGSVTFFDGATPFSTNNLVAGAAVSASIGTLARGTNSITAIYNGTVNFYGSTNSVDQVVTNHPPVVASVNYYRGAVDSFKITISELMTNASDADGDTLAVSFGTSTNGINLIVSNNLALYYNTNLVNDQLAYTVNDAFGGSNSASITITSSPFLTGQNATVIVSGSTATVGFAGIPGYNYGIQRSTNLTSWVGIWTTNAPPGGLFDFTDDFNDLGVVPGSAYYRLQWNP